MSVVAPTRALKEVKALAKVKLGEYSSADSEKFKAIAAFDCRGMEPCNCYPVSVIIHSAAGGKKFENIDISDPDGWFEYDDVNAVPVQIEDLAFEFRVAK